MLIRETRTKTNYCGPDNNFLDCWVGTDSDVLRRTRRSLPRTETFAQNESSSQSVELDYFRQIHPSSSDSEYVNSASEVADTESRDSRSLYYPQNVEMQNYDMSGAASGNHQRYTFGESRLASIRSNEYRIRPRSIDLGSRMNNQRFPNRFSDIKMEDFFSLDSVESPYYNKRADNAGERNDNYQGFPTKPSIKFDRPTHQPSDRPTQSSASSSFSDDADLKDRNNFSNLKTAYPRQITNPYEYRPQFPHSYETFTSSQNPASFSISSGNSFMNFDMGNSDSNIPLKSSHDVMSDYERPLSERPQYDRSHSERPQYDHPGSERPHSERPQYVERPHSERPQYDRPHPYYDEYDRNVPDNEIPRKETPPHPRDDVHPNYRPYDDRVTERPSYYALPKGQHINYAVEEAYDYSDRDQEQTRHDFPIQNSHKSQMTEAIRKPNRPRDHYPPGAYESFPQEIIHDKEGDQNYMRYHEEIEYHPISTYGDLLEDKNNNIDKNKNNYIDENKNNYIDEVVEKPKYLNIKNTKVEKQNTGVRHYSKNSNSKIQTPKVKPVKALAPKRNKVQQKTRVKNVKNSKPKHKKRRRIRFPPRRCNRRTTTCNRIRTTTEKSATEKVSSTGVTTTVAPSRKTLPPFKKSLKRYGNRTRTKGKRPIRIPGTAPQIDSKKIRTKARHPDSKRRYLDNDCFFSNVETRYVLVLIIFQLGTNIYI